MNNLKQFVKSHQQALVLVIGYVLVAGIGFGLGQLTSSHKKAPEIRLEETTASNDNYTPTVSGLQSESNCVVKGTISSKIYHLPGQNGYDKLTGPMCFATEAEAITAGYRKALR